MIYALAITGPTASGKTSLSVALAKELGAEIISADSMQIYRGMDIGTAKVTRDEMENVPHHLIDIISPLENYSTESYRADAVATARSISERGRVPLFAGGTGLYIDTLMRAPQTDVPKSLNTKGVSDTPCEISEDEKNSLWQRLYEVDPESALIIHKNNVRRVRRAIEIFEETGIPKSRLDKLSREKPQDISIEMITLDFKNRDNLYSRIDARVDEMMRCGLLDEVRRLYDGGLLRKDSTAAQAIGYKELTRYLDGEISLDGAVDLIKLSSRRYAKRQLTWFRHNKDAYRLFVDDDDGMLRSFDDVLKEALNVSREMLAKISTKGDSDEIC